MTIYLAFVLEPKLYVKNLDCISHLGRFGEISKSMFGVFLKMRAYYLVHEDALSARACSETLKLSRMVRKAVMLF